MLKRIVMLVVVGSFLAVPPAIAKSSSTVKAPAVKSAPTLKAAPHSDGQCPYDTDAAAL
ncbi:MAG: hypothetical protein MSC30_17315 [Gaiellaceae bacterium MAG52_C11]|nr:hypothetical protein [Candidatus Gaiellasilicea maunaloa]